MATMDACRNLKQGFPPDKERMSFAWGCGSSMRVAPIGLFYYDNDESHLGHQNLLLQSGLVGYFFMNLFIFSLLFKLFISRKKANDSDHGKALLSAGYLLIGIYVIHTSVTIFSYLPSNWGAFYGFFLSFCSYHYNKIENYS